MEEHTGGDQGGAWRPLHGSVQAHGVARSYNRGKGTIGLVLLRYWGPLWPRGVE